MRVGIVFLSLIVLLLLTGVLPVSGGMNASAVYYAPAFIALLALLSGCSLVCCVRRKFGLKQVGFYLVHLGVVAILSGAFVGYVLGVKGPLKLSLQPKQFTGLVPQKEREPVALGFDVAAEDFEVKFYPPVYQLYLPLPPEAAVPGQMPFKVAGEFSTDKRQEWDLGEAGLFAVSNLWDRVRKEWTPQIRLADGSFLFQSGKTPSFFGVKLRVRDGDQELELPISVNHPAGYKGWRFYLMSYDQNAQRYVQLSARRDPGRRAVIAGIWMTIIGTFMLGFRREKRRDA